MSKTLVWRTALRNTLQGQSIKRLLQIPLYSHIHTYRSECRSLNSWLAKRRREAEYSTLIDWWKCRASEDYEACKRWHGKTLRVALKKYKRTSLYKWRKAHRPTS